MIPTRVALHVDGDNLYFGHRTIAELLGCETATGLLAMACMGRRLSVEERAVLDGIAVAMCSADPRIWPLKLTRLIASYGSTLAGYGAAQLAMEGRQIGPWVVGHAASELVALHLDIGDRVGEAADRTLRDFASKRSRIAGYGVPFRALDERMEGLRGEMARLGRDRLRYWVLQEALSAAMSGAWQVAPNVGVGAAAALLDVGCTPLQASALATFLNQNVFAANAFEAAQQREPLMQRLPDEHVEYVGPAPRVSPRAAGATRGA